MQTMNDIVQACAAILRLKQACPWWSPNLPLVAPLVVAFYQNEPAGGGLHVVLDDGNIEDDSVRYCVNQAAKEGDAPAELLGRVLLLMSRTQRIELYRRPKP